jgi:hypothetical protein
MPSYILGANGEDQRLTLMIRLWLQSKLADHFYGHHPVFKKLQLLNQVVTGGFGEKVSIPIKYPAAGGPTPEGVQNAYSAMSHSEMTGYTSSLWDIAHIRMPISIPERELELTGSNTKKVSTLDSVMEIATDRFNDYLKQQVWGTEATSGGVTTLWPLRTLYNRGTNGTTTTPYSPAGLSEQLGEAVGTTPVKTVGNLNRGAAGNGYFCTPVLNPGSAETLAKASINKLITLGIKGSDKPDLLILERNHYDTAMGILQAQRYISESKLADYGFDAFMWRGCDVIFDDDVPTAVPGVNAFAINTKALKLLVKTMEPDVQPIQGRDDSIKAWKANWYGQLVMVKMGRGAGARHANLAA